MKRLGSQTIKFDNPITILETASIVGPKESQGPLAEYFDKCLEDEFLSHGESYKMKTEDTHWIREL